MGEFLAADPSDLHSIAAVAGNQRTPWRLEFRATVRASLSVRTRVACVLTRGESNVL